MKHRTQSTLFAFVCFVFVLGAFHQIMASVDTTIRTETEAKKQVAEELESILKDSDLWHSKKMLAPTDLLRLRTYIEYTLNKYELALDDLNEQQQSPGPDFNKAQISDPEVRRLKRELEDIDRRILELEVQTVDCKRKEINADDKLDGALARVTETYKSLHGQIAQSYESLNELFIIMNVTAVPKQMMPTMEEIFLRGRANFTLAMHSMVLEFEPKISGLIEDSVHTTVNRVKEIFEDSMNKTTQSLEKSMQEASSRLKLMRDERLKSLGRDLDRMVKARASETRKVMQTYAPIEAEEGLRHFFRSGALDQLVNRLVDRVFDEYTSLNKSRIEQIKKDIQETQLLGVKLQESGHNITEIARDIIFNLTNIATKFSDPTNFVTEEELPNFVEAVIREEITRYIERPVLIERRQPASESCDPDKKECEVNFAPESIYARCKKYGTKCYVFELDNPSAETPWSTHGRLKSVALTFNKEESGCKADMAPANFLISVHKAGSNGAPIPFVFSDELGTQTFVVDKPVTADKVKIMFLGNRGNPKFICLNDITFHAH